MLGFNPYFEFATVFYLIAVLCCSVFIYRRTNLQSRRFRRLTAMLLLANLLDVVTTYSVAAVTDKTLSLNYMLCSALYLCNVLSTVLYVRYVRAIVNKPGNKIILGIHTGIISVYCLAIVLDFKLHEFFFFDENLEYQYGPFQFVQYILIVWMVLYALGLLLRNRSSLSVRQIGAAGSFSIIIVVVVLLQLLLFPQILLGLFAGGLATVIVMLSLETPDYAALMDTMEKLENAKTAAEEEKKKAEEARAVAEEEKKKAEEARAIAEEERKKAEETKLLAEKANQTKSKFLANMSHEIRTPINAIMGLNSIIAEETNLEAIHSMSVNVVRASNILYTIINDILDFSKLESGKLEIIPADYKPSDFVDDLKNMCEKKANEKHLALQIKTENLPEYLFGDETRMRQIILNLTSNAIKYTQEGSVDVLFSYDNGNLIIDVKDSGQGIREEDLPHLFDTFTRFEQDQNKHIEGTGLGLSIVQNLVRLMNGTVEVRSVFGEGSEFKVSIPQRIVTDHVVTKQEMKEQEEIDLSGYRILYVDDTRPNLMVFRGLLKKTNAKVEAVPTPEIALEILSHERFDLLFFDYLMPNMNGIELFHKVREMGIQTPVVALTADAINDAKDKFFEAGFADFLAKPIKRPELIAVIVKLLEPTPQK